MGAVPRYFAVPPQVFDTPKGQFTVGIEKLTDIRDELAPLLKAHWAETKVGSPLTFNVAYENYLVYEERGQFILFSARNAAGEFAGYLACYMIRNSQARGDLVATEEGLYLRPDARGSNMANKLLEYAQRVLKQFGCKLISITSRHYSGGPDLSQWLTRRGFRRDAVEFVKEL